MKLSIRQLFFLSSVVVASGSAWSWAVTNEDATRILQNVRGHAPEQWRRYAESIRCLSYDGNLHVISKAFNPNSKSLVTELDVTYGVTVHQDVQKSRRLKLMTESGATGFYVTNERYNFAGGIESKLDSFKLYEGSADPDTSTYFRNDCDAYLEAPMSVFGIPIQSMLDEDGFQTTSATSVSVASASGNDPAIRLEFQCNGQTEGSSRGARYLGGTYWVELDPTTWLAKRGGIIRKKDSKTERLAFSIKYGERFQERPFPSEVATVDETDENGRVVNAHQRTFFFRQPRVFKDDEGRFFLPAYGVSEDSVDFLNSGGTFRLIAFILGLLGLIVAVLGIRFFRTSNGKELRSAGQ